MRHGLEIALLAALVAVCWLGCLGMLRMREPIAALHYLSLPSGIGSVLLPCALLCSDGWSDATVKCVLMAVLLLAANSVVAHATARAIRVRAKGHWEAREGDRVHFIHGGPGQ